MSDYSQGIAADGPAILQNGIPMTPEQIVLALNRLESEKSLILLKADKFMRAVMLKDGNPVEHAAELAAILNAKRGSYKREGNSDEQT